MIHTDYHFHSAFSSDSTTPLKEQILAGIQNYQLQTMCITDHMDFDFPDNEEGLTFLFDMNEYIHEITTLKEEFANRESTQNFTLLTGIEFGVLSHLGPKLTQFMKTFGSKLDFVIASSHLVNMIDPYDSIYFETYGERRGIELYLQSIIDNINAFQDFDVYGHLDYVVRYAPNKDHNYNPFDYMDYYDEILKKLISLGKGIELNTAGWKAGLQYAHPHIEVLKRYKELGGEIITIGSDGHKPEHLAYDFDRVPGLLKNAGFDYYTIFKQRKAEFIKVEP